MSVIEARNLWFSYTRKNPVLKGVNLRVKAGEVVALAGPTGSGKSTLLLLLAGLLTPDKGEVLLDGRPLSEQLPMARQRIGILFQNPDDQLFNPTVYDEIAYALRSLGLEESIVRERVHSIARQLGIEELLPQPPYKLSIGQRRLVALASILVYDPDILLLDEPTANLDRQGIMVLSRAIRTAARRGKIVIMASHDLDAIIEYSTRTCILHDGRLYCKPTLDALREGVFETTSLPIPLGIRLLKYSLGGWEKVAELAKTVRRKPDGA
ncbi:energy-coupling factor ABC transporter ATP-binding protein [Hyperthermus butylicus]|uniref:ABC-type cobalt transport system, ATPase (CbiO) n=1 Tax=Hyperthermus butylicus (strain DSM 5456 / JCM 9403 / PLM1-5) TaxID=415426 RepID=A2BJF0_HYPBU|nr:ABC transporter ATP-binding protein [Hyperthermus butylicus]ABM80111.1 ABC-type cobalt transport system, ATPase (CbiO) [Hyperthermus butylicus DSM 5456]